jgi:hypothetical protein
MPAARLWKTMEPERSDAILCPPRSNHPGNLLGLGFSCDGSREVGISDFTITRQRTPRGPAIDAGPASDPRE